jgi:hypothetical protein
MDAALLRNIGITIGAAALAGALAVSQLAGAPDAPAPAEAPIVEAPMAGPAAVEAQTPVFETADASAPPAATAELSFLVHFEGAGPLGRAQSLAARGREGEAGRAAQAALARQSTLRGLCFDRFTVGGAEMVLRTCEGVGESQRAQVSAQWLARLRDMPSVAYAEPNATADAARPR